MVNFGGDGSDFAIFVATILQTIGAHVRLSLGCTKNASMPEATAASSRYRASLWAYSSVDGPSWRGSHGDSFQACQMFAEVRLGRNPSKILTWVRTWLPASRWLGKEYRYRLDYNGYAWLNLDWVDSSRLQRPGTAFKSFDSMTIYYPSSLRWETEGDYVDSLGHPKLQVSAAESLRMGTR